MKDKIKKDLTKNKDEKRDGSNKKNFTLDSKEFGISLYRPKNDENRLLDYFCLIFDHTLKEKLVIEGTNKYNFHTVLHVNLPERYQETIDATESEIFTFFALNRPMAYTKKKSNKRLLVY